MNRTLPSMVRESAEAHLENIAFKCGSRSLSYRELEVQMNQLANLLIERGIKKGDRVGVFLNRSIETAITIYGIMNAGAVYVPLDPFAPKSRIKKFMEDCGIRHLVSNQAMSTKVNDLLRGDSSVTTVIGLNIDLPIKSISWDEVAGMDASNPSVEISESDLAYIMYTSGSTGVPKGIMHTHFSGYSYARLSAELYKLTPKDKIANHAPLHFDISTLGYFSGPLSGSTTVILPEAYTKMPASLSKLMEDEKITVWYSVPLALIQLLSNGVLDQRNLSSIRWVLYGGEPFPAKYLKQLMEHWPQATISNVYGPAEVNQCTYYNFKTPPEVEEIIPLGTVWDDTEMLVLNENDEAVSPNEIGELLIKTITMMKGYWNQPELTAKSLYRTSDENGKEDVYYRTGDLVKLDADGLLHFIGRKDRQIKTRGFRVELDEIENALVAHKAVHEAAVFPVENEDKGYLIEAAVILNSEIDDTENTILAFLKNEIPWYAIPQKIHIKNTFPRTSTGKIDRLQLQEQHSKLTKA